MIVSFQVARSVQVDAKRGDHGDCRSSLAANVVRHRQTSRCWSGNFVSPLSHKDALLEAVSLTEAEKLAAAEPKFDEAKPPIEALRAWMMLFFDYIATKQIIAPVTEYAGRKFLEGVRSLKGDEGKPIAIHSTIH
jgi:hypothetical protein